MSAKERLRPFAFHKSSSRIHIQRYELPPNLSSKIEKGLCESQNKRTRLASGEDDEGKENKINAVNDLMDA